MKPFVEEYIEITTDLIEEMKVEVEMAIVMTINIMKMVNVHIANSEILPEISDKVQINNNQSKDCIQVRRRMKMRVV